MTKNEMLEIADKFEEEDIPINAFELIEEKLSTRHDLHVYLLLDRILSRNPKLNKSHDLITAARNSEVFFSVDPKDLASVITKEEIRELILCNVSFDPEGLSMFV